MLNQTHLKGHQYSETPSMCMQQWKSGKHSAFPTAGLLGEWGKAGMPQLRTEQGDDLEIHDYFLVARAKGIRRRG